MKCPVCRSKELSKVTLSQGLEGYSCDDCGGSWIRFADYDAWKNASEQVQNGACHEEYRPEFDSKRLGLCPDCGVLLTKYKVSPALPFVVDHCASCNGVWLDRDEWETIVDQQLHREINAFFTSAWQKKLREELTRERLEEHYQEKFGAIDYEKLKDIREWVQSHPRRDDLIAFLINKDPFSI